MASRVVASSVKPYLSVLAVLITAGLLVAAILFTELNRQWTIFLAGILVAAVLSLASRAAEAQWTIARRSARLLQLQEKLSRETQQRADAERLLDATRLRLHLLDEVLPVGVVHIAPNGSIRFHNRVFREQFGARNAPPDGRFLHELLGARAYAEIARHVERVQGGDAVEFRQEIHWPDGSSRHLVAHYLPNIGPDSRQDGFFAVYGDAPGAMPNETRTQPLAPVASGQASGTAVASDLALESDAEELIGGKDAVTRILSAIEQNEFRLYCQRIAPLAVPDAPAHYEVLIRLLEEEEGMMPPGAFFPLVEKYGLMPHLDRWVVQHVAEWLVLRLPGNSMLASAAFFINVAPQTLQDSSFPDFVAQQLERCQVPPARLCFELTHAQLAERPDVTKTFANKLGQLGCSLALSGFGRGGPSFAYLQGLGLNFLKIDGSVVLDIERDASHLARVAGMANVAASLEVKTVAELVESEISLERLRAAGVDYAQGFAISTPRPLDDVA